MLGENSIMLAEYFKGLSDLRGDRSTYLLEHPLKAEETENLRQELFQLLSYHPLNDSFWDERALDICIIATEVGYRYRGTGTDFWPLLARQMGISASGPERSRIVELFKKVALRYRIRRPGHTPWEEHFPLIAWPIGNAVAPVEIHAALAKTLRQVIREGVRPSSGNDFLSRMKYFAAGLSSARFSSWLKNENIAVELASRLLQQEVVEPQLPDQLVSRIASDLARNKPANKMLSEARALLTRRSSSRRKEKVENCHLVLDPNGQVGKLLFLQGPFLPLLRRQELVLSMNLPRDAIHLRGASGPVPIADLLAGARIPLPDLKDLETPILIGSSSLEGSSDEAAKILNELEPPHSRVFIKGKIDENFYSVQGKSGIASGRQYYLAPDEGDLRDLEAWTLLHPSVPDEFRQLCKHLHGEKLEAAAPAFFGLPAPGCMEKYLSTFPLIGPADEFPDEFQDPNNDETGICRRVVSADGHMFSIAELQEGTWRTPEGKNVSIVDPLQSPGASIMVDPLHPSIDDFINGNLSVSVSAPLPLENVKFEVQIISPGDELIQISEVITRLPARLTGFSPLFRKARKQFSQDQLGADNDSVDLVLIAHDLVRIVKRLRTRPINFILNDNGDFLSTDCSDGGNAESVFSTIEANVEGPLLGSPETKSQSGTRLLLPNCNRPGALVSGVLIGSPERTHLSDNVSQSPVPWLREADDLGDRNGLRNVARSLIGWRLAKADNPIGDIHRHRAISRLEATTVMQLCGGEWAKREGRIDTSVLHPLSVFLELAARRGLTGGSDFPKLPDRRDQILLNEILERRFKNEIQVPEQELASWSDQRGEDFDMVVIDAYDELLERVTETGRPGFEEVDISFPPSRWQATLRDSIMAPRLRTFRHLVLPQSRWQQLAEADYSDLSPDEIVDLLDSAHVDAYRQPGRRRIGREELRALLLFWLDPAKLLALGDWEPPLLRNLSDVFTSRAIRYAILRQRVSWRDLPDATGQV